MNAPLLRLEGVSKVYPRVHHPGERLRAVMAILAGRTPSNGVEVLSDIDLVVERGQSLGIIGENGAGKSTLLKILTGVIQASAGTVEVNARIAALLELGAGFQPEFTGMDNVRMNAALLGMSPSEVDERLDDILSFADIGDYVFEPVKHYSSGMVVRLGFAVVAASRPELLITDEVLAVGDESFQKKCLRWIERFLDDGGTLLMVSHSMYVVQKLCRRALWLQGGRARMLGDVFPVTQSYLAWHEQRNAHEKEGAQSADGEAGIYCVAGFRLEVSGRAATPDGEVVLHDGEDLTVDLRLTSPDGRPPVALVGVVRADGTPVYGIASDVDGVALKPTGDGHYAARLTFERPALLPGSYSIRAHALDPEGLRVCDSTEQRITVLGETRELGFVRLDHRWDTE